MSDFEQDFMSKVKGEEQAPKGGVVEGVVVANKKSLDRRWFIIGGLIVVLAAVAIVLSVIGSRVETDGGGNMDTIVGRWSCDDESEITFSEDGNVSWVDEIGRIEDEYIVNGGVIKFGAVSLRYEDERITIDIGNGGQVTCERMGDE
jgi:hypothetical protein